MFSRKVIALFVCLVFSLAITGCKKPESEKTATANGSIVASKSQTAVKTTNVKSTSVKSSTQASTIGNGGNGSGDANPDDSGLETNPGETPDVDEEPGKEEVYDLKGAKIITMFWAPKWEDRLVTSGPEGFETAIDNRIKEAEARYNFLWEPQLVTPNAAHSTNFINASLAGIKYCDILVTQSYFAFPTFTNNKLIIPVDKYIDFENHPFYSINDYGKNTNFWRGRYWGISDLNGNIGMNMLYNKGLFDREGQRDLQQIVDAKQWTWDELVRIFLETTKDLDGDGIIDQWGMVVQAQSFMAMGLLWSNGGRYLVEQNDKVLVGFTEAKAIRALQFYTDLYNVHKVVGNSPNLFPQGKAMIIVGFAGLGATARNAGINYRFAPMPMGPDVNDYQHVTLSGNQYVFSAMVEEPEKVVKIFAEIYNPLSDSPHTLSMDAVFTAWLQRWYEPYDIERTLNYGKKLAFDMFYGFPEFNTMANNQLYLPIATGNTSVGMLVDQLAPALQNILDRNIQY